MDLHLQNKNFLICGASSGFGNAIAKALLSEGANVYLVARREERLNEIAAQYPGRVHYLTADLKEQATIHKIMERIEDIELNGSH